MEAAKKKRGRQPTPASPRSPYHSHSASTLHVVDSIKIDRQDYTLVYAWDFVGFACRVGKDAVQQGSRPGWSVYKGLTGYWYII